MKGIVYLPKTIQQASDIKLLAEYGFDFEKNLEEYFHSIAEEMRKAINENIKNK